MEPYNNYGRYPYNRSMNNNYVKKTLNTNNSCNNISHSNNLCNTNSCCNNSNPDSCKSNLYINNSYNSPKSSCDKNILNDSIQEKIINKDLTSMHNHQLANAYIKIQDWDELYCPSQAICEGTAFPSLNLIFCGKRGKM